MTEKRRKRLSRAFLWVITRHRALSHGASPGARKLGWAGGWRRRHAARFLAGFTLDACRDRERERRGGAETSQLKFRLVRGNRGVSCWEVTCVNMDLLLRWWLRLPDFVAKVETPEFVFRPPTSATRPRRRAMLAAREAARRDHAAASPPVRHETWNTWTFIPGLVDIDPADRWIPGFEIIGPYCEAQQQSSWLVDVIKAMRYWRKGEPVESPQTWYARHLRVYMYCSDNYCDVHGEVTRWVVPPDLRAAIVEGDKIEGITVNEQGRANSRSVLDVRRSCRVAPSPGTANPSPSVVSEANKHSQPLREVIDACRASLLKKPQAWQMKQHAAAAAYCNGAFWLEQLSMFRRKVAACWVLREDARRRQEDAAREVAAREVAQVAVASKARAVAAAGGGEGGNGGPAGALEASGAVQVLMRCVLQHF